MQRLGLLFVAAMMMASARQAAADQKVVEEGLSKAFEATFKQPACQKYDFKPWQEAVVPVQSLVTGSCAKDSVLKKSLDTLVDQNKILLANLTLISKEGADLGKFEGVFSESKQAQAALKKATFAMPSKRDCRKVLVQFAQYLEEAASNAKPRFQICTNVDKLGALRELNRMWLKSTAMDHAAAAQKSLSSIEEKLNLDTMLVKEQPGDSRRLTSAKNKIVKTTGLIGKTFRQLGSVPLGLGWTAVLVRWFGDA